MTDISWLIYLMGLLANLSTFFQILLFISIAFFVIGIIVFSVTPEHQHDHKEITEVAFNLMKYAGSVAVLLGFILIFLPSERTVMLIAASEVSHIIINSDTTKEIFDPTVRYLNKELEESFDE